MVGLISGTVVGPVSGGYGAKVTENNQVQTNARIQNRDRGAQVVEDARESRDAVIAKRIQQSDAINETHGGIGAILKGVIG